MSIRLIFEIVENNYKYKKLKSYADLNRMILGKEAGMLMNFLISTLSITAPICYTVFISKFIQTQFCQMDMNSTCLQRYIHFLLSLIILMPLTQIRNFSNFGLVTTLGNVFCIGGILFTINYCLSNILIHGIKKQPLQDPAIGQIIAFFGQCIMSNEGLVVLFEMRNSMENQHKFIDLYTGSFILTNILNVVYPIICIFGFGMHTQGIFKLTTDIALYSLPNDTQSKIVQLLYVTALSVNFAILLTPTFNLVQIFFEQLLTPIDAKEKYKNPSNLIFITSRIIITIVIVLVAYFIPTITVLISFTGCLCASLVNFLFPVILWRTEFQNQKDKWTLLKQAELLMYLIVALSLLLIGTYTSYQKAFHQIQQLQLFMF